MRQTEYTKAFADEITDKIVKEYNAGIARGGSVCVEPIYTDLGNGYVRCSTKHRFVPWLDDLLKEQQAEVLRIFIEGERDGVRHLIWRRASKHISTGSTPFCGAAELNLKIAQTADCSYKKSK